ncbi:MAG TPA: acetyl-CoA C-acyltransferase, partial [Dermatophilaceae bacterium]|nr:acetyl-CoA C-acyltransferase [Dermatophilaceae bacterium]
MSTSSPRPVAVLGGNRVPFARSGGAYAKATNADLLTTTIDGLVARFGLAGERVGEVVAGAAVKHAPGADTPPPGGLGTQRGPPT